MNPMTLPQNVKDAMDVNYAPGELDRTAPERIWLQVDTNGDNNDRDEPWSGDDASWCAESIGGLEIQYVRADLLHAHLLNQEAEIDRLLKRVEFTQQWYAERFERLRDLGKERGCWSEMATIIANGSLSGFRDPNGNISYEPPTYAQQMNMLRHRANLAESRLAAANALLLNFSKAVADTAFKMRAPNQWTPVFVQMAQEAERQSHLQGAGGHEADENCCEWYQVNQLEHDAAAAHALMMAQDEFWKQDDLGSLDARDAVEMIGVRADELMQQWGFDTGEGA